ncbi:calcium-dependent protein 5 [Plasmopara halstedii]|uniref:Calcium-dependent protein 5 n=1 Tax=Plasmopara halstedii TaxID=4781 RepID=A0A0P1AJF7_PLAHL|nr:calcium-dependent protein 5 [Plasmopara halstedii]CEG41004.1 calcium-dependent protein 5 [Plasmopara halstedii]|eukprot:XP_024577373.1 calcium-dependent protein 5 [Plasmopara halstedii]
MSASTFARSRAVLRRKPKPDKKVLDNEDPEEVKEAFRLFETASSSTIEAMMDLYLYDDGDTGKVLLRDLKRVCTELGETLTDEEMHDMIDEADCDGDGLLNEKDFFRVLKKSVMGIQWTTSATMIDSHVILL